MKDKVLQKRDEILTEINKKINLLEKRDAEVCSEVIVISFLELMEEKTWEYVNKVPYSAITIDQSNKQILIRKYGWCL